MSAVDQTIEAGVATVTMNQPHNRNALTPVLLNGLGDALAAAAADDDVRVVVLTHTGPAFCAGADLAGPAPDSEEVRYDLAAVLAAILSSPKPVIARIAGHCLGGGIGLAAACDLSVASDDVRLGFTEVRIGVIPAIVSVVCLPKLRRGDALRLFLTGERVAARDAAGAGLITMAVPAGDLDATVASLVDQVRQGAPAALAAAKRLVLEPPAGATAQAFEIMTELSRSLFDSAEAAEGMSAFREKRPPRWAG